LTRQDVPVLDGTADAGEGVARGGYVLVEEQGGTPDIVLVGTGSEVQLCVGAAAVLAAGPDGRRARVVSLPSWELFAEQDDAYRMSILPPGVPTLAVEAATSFGWDRYADDSISIDHFGASAPGGEVLAHFGYTTDNVVARARALLTTRELS
jgi:transketolase